MIRRLGRGVARRRETDGGMMNESQYMLCSLDGQQYGNGAYLNESHSYYDRTSTNPYAYATQLPEASLPRQHPSQHSQHPHHQHQLQQPCRLQQSAYELASDARLELISVEPPAAPVAAPPSTGSGLYYDGSNESCSRPYHSVYYAGAQEDLGSVREGFHQGVLSNVCRGPVPPCYSSYYPTGAEQMDGIGLLGGNPGLVGGHSMSGYCTSASSSSSLVPGNDLDSCSFDHQQTTPPPQTTFKWLTVRRSHPKTVAGMRIWTLRLSQNRIG